MSGIERIFLSEGCCSFGLVGDSAELWMALLLGVSFSGILVLSCNIWSNRGNNANSNNSHLSANLSHNLCSSPDCIRCHPDIRSINITIEANLKRHLSSRNSGTCDSNLNIDRVCQAVSKHLSREKLGLRERPTANLGQNPTLFYFPKLMDRPWWSWDKVSNVVPRKLKTDLRYLEWNAHRISADFRSLDELFRKEPEISGWQVNVPGGWRVFHLLDQGRFRAGNCVRCPDTLLVVNQLKNLMVNCVFGFASFSVLEPGAAIDTHCGTTNVRLRCHLGISVSSGCQMTVAEKSRTWMKHQCLLFDDSYPHSVSHHGTSPRVIFMADFWHPDLSSAERTAFQEIFPPKRHESKQGIN